MVGIAFKMYLILFLLLLLMITFIDGCKQEKEIQKNSQGDEKIDQSLETVQGDPMKLTSKSFEQNESIPTKFTCDGNNTNPALAIGDIPATAKSLVLIMDDPDIPTFVKQKYGIEVWDHWVVFNIPPATTFIEEGKNPTGILGVNTAGKKAYAGPCPPDREHRYFFKLYALDTMLSLKEGATKKQVEEAMVGHILAKAELVGSYERVNK